MEELTLIWPFPIRKGKKEKGNHQHHFIKKVTQGNRENKHKQCLASRKMIYLASFFSKRCLGRLRTSNHCILIFTEIRCHNWKMIVVIFPNNWLKNAESFETNLKSEFSSKQIDWQINIQVSTIIILIQNRKPAFAHIIS